MRDIGLIGCSLNGTVKIFDGFDFAKELWRSSNKSRKQKFHTQITCFDVTVQLGMMATGGTDGRVIVYDPYAFGIIGAMQAHPGFEVLTISFYNEQ